ncbi:MAG: hypothetical protein WC907_00375 [Acholeplasmataceae bacterium]
MGNKNYNIGLKLDKNFTPAVLYINDLKKEILKTDDYNKVSIVIERMDGYNESYETVVFGDNNKRFDENIFYLERLIKSLLWIYGGFKITIVGSKKIYENLKPIFTGGKRKFDTEFMTRIYEEDFKFLYSDTLPNIKKGDQAIGKHLDGYRIGFDAGGSDMKVSAVVNGESIHSEEIVWLPKVNKDPMYHKKMIRKAIYKAVEKLPKVDALGVSSAGVYIHNEAKVASLFIEVPLDLFEKHVKNIYKDIAKELNVPLVVANDGDVTALAGSMSLGKNSLLGIAMGTSEAAGYVNEKGNIVGWLNELAFVPVDYQENGPNDEWSNDIGCGVKYFSQDAVIRLAEKSGITFDETLSPAEKLLIVQNLDSNSDIYKTIYHTMGVYLGFGLALYREFYDFNDILLLGRVTSGVGGQIMIKQAKETLKEYFPELSKTITFNLPDEWTRRVGQSIAAASLVKL